MRPLITLSARWSALATAIVLALGLAAGTVRLLPWLLEPEVPWRLAVPFARLLVSGAVEAALLVGVPVGVGIATALFIERGEARALAALGASPARLAFSLSAPAFLLIVASVTGASFTGPDSPGRLASRLVEAGRVECRERASPRRIDVPLFSLSWLCFPGSPRVVGRVPGLGQSAWFSATDLRPNDDLRELALQDVHVALPLGKLLLSLRVQSANIAGLPGWGRSRRVAGAARGLVVAGSAALTALAGAWLGLSRAVAEPIASAARSGAASAAMLAAVRSLDAHALPLADYVGVPAVGIFALAAAALIAFYAEKWRVAVREPG